ncbi:hypothetical protein H2198_006209 [Neophaeococcomyces mojaviensis]|uniref:Uncharacterized protein n=1 Tax=Neophaeococcomyces mojaviensis TaxID=3383035 RepID=A0ACC3A3D6_9EURO|nr:hypothetical protein H2198_006209 [Knufia sp. JES_112]
MAVAVHRSTAASSLDVSQSQVTAPVLEYRCMFTHDVLKKQKKWHDGTLRFHTFNKRVMVYDDSKNFVGDLHYRLAEEFGEGLELRLERPVLVQVEEQLGQTKTDLTPLLARQKQDSNAQSSATTQPTRATLSRINAANSQIKPKSIKELLLGASQGRLGRSRLPVQSPYEQRQALSEVQPNEPPPKRRKIGHDKENRPAVVQLPAEPVLPRQHTLESRKTERPVAKEVIDLSSDDGGIHPPRAAQTPKEDATGQSTAVPVVRPASSSIIEELPKSRQRSKVSARKPKSSALTRNGVDDHNDRARPKKASKKKGRELGQLAETVQSPGANHTFNASVISDQVQPTGPRSSLKFAAQKPRPKLMYRALLADASSTNATNISKQQSTAATSKVNPTNDTVARKRRPQTSAIDMDNFFAASQIADAAADDAASSPPHSREQIPKDSETTLETTMLQSLPNNGLGNGLAEGSADDENITMVADSPLFMPRTASQMSPLPTQHFMINDLELPLLSQIALIDASQRHRSRVADMEEDLQHHESNDADVVVLAALESDCEPNSHSDPRKTVAEKGSDAESPAEDGRLHTSLSMGQAANVAIPRPAVLDRETPSRSRPFRRVVSENLPNNDAGLDALFDEFDDDDSDDEFQLKSPKLNRKTPRRAQDPKPHPPPQLRQATSDSAVLEAITTVCEAAEEGRPLHRAVPQQVAEETHLLPQVIPASQTEQELEMAAESGNTLGDTGAWTTTEAFLLFDWWPPGKEKPDYGQETTTLRVPSGRIGAAVGNMASINAMSAKKYGMFGSAKLVSQR